MNTEEIFLLIHVLKSLHGKLSAIVLYVPDRASRRQVMGI